MDKIYNYGELSFYFMPLKIVITMSQLVYERTIGGMIFTDKVSIIDALCNNCNKRFKSMRAITMHLKMTGAGHAVTFINHGNYDKNTGLRLRHK
ncbi:MAG: hypothetical protein WAZ77_09375 [Candidatus Nitrosopolaris sp.]